MAPGKRLILQAPDFPNIFTFVIIIIEIVFHLWRWGNTGKNSIKLAEAANLPGTAAMIRRPAPGGCPHFYCLTVNGIKEKGENGENSCCSW